MKSFLRLSLAATAIVLFFNAFAVTEIKAQAGPLNNILKRMDAHNKALTSLQSSVRMDKYNSQLRERDTTEGTATYLPQKGKDALVRIDWTKPVAESLAVINKKYILYRPRLNQAFVGKVDSVKSGGKGANNALAFINMSKAQLKANYNIVYIGQENVGGAIPTWHLQLTPKTAQSYKTADLWVDGNGMPIQAQVSENNGDSTTIFLSNIEKNKKIDAKIFQIALPPKTKIVEG